jgi:hypothetical protein
MVGIACNREERGVVGLAIVGVVTSDSSRGWHTDGWTSSRVHLFKATDQLSTIVTGTDRASSVALLIRKRCPSGAGA